MDVEFIKDGYPGPKLLYLNEALIDLLQMVSNVLHLVLVLQQNQKACFGFRSQYFSNCNYENSNQLAIPSLNLQITTNTISIGSKTVLLRLLIVQLLYHVLVLKQQCTVQGSLNKISINLHNSALEKPVYMALVLSSTMNFSSRGSYSMA
ncbi:Hypothetical_protein [Hexamita inflata]|uniref:Hypothetical_protein n=1 Tax=Hexamita inflata TaxID=28002 RepID=A0AA86U212_9EUKA|nr:Hypothetical protein HINF_LOCUS15873 [Hexamita inflata]